jgi:hypothetical protein
LREEHRCPLLDLLANEAVNAPFFPTDTDPRLVGKAKSENLTPDQEKRLRAAVETIKREFRHENQGH